MLNELEHDGYIKKLQPDPRRTRNALDLAQRDVESAQRMLEVNDYDWAFNIAYNSMLQSVRALMFHLG